MDQALNLKKRLARGNPGNNSLDKAYKEHDIVYSQNKENITARNTADKVLAEKAWNRVLARDAKIGEKAAAWAVTNATKIKSNLGMRVKKRKKRLGLPLKKIVSAAKKSIYLAKDAHSVISSALQGVRAAVKKAGRRRNVNLEFHLNQEKLQAFYPFFCPFWQV